MLIPRLCVAATSGGGGKTLLTLGLGRLWATQGLAVKPFKKGPDYIDAMWLTAACGHPATNLDPYFMNGTEMTRLFISSMRGYNLALLEGNRGLYDGLNESGSCSTAQVARTLACPILLCLDCSKTTRTAAAIIYGMTRFEDGLQFMGVILNRVGSSRHEDALRKALESNTDLPVLGALPRLATNPIPERYMGLIPAAENQDQTLESLAEWVKQGCDTDKILSLASTSTPLPDLPAERKQEGATSGTPPAGTSPVIGVACDKAFWFYYRENLEALETAGCRVRAFSLLAKDLDISNFDALYLGGGFPEDFLAELSEARAAQELKALAVQGMPIYAECGGMMILCKSITRDKRVWPMAGLFDAEVHCFARPQGLGYVSGEISEANPFYPAGLSIRGHEFHYSICRWQSPPRNLALALNRGTGIWQDENGNAWDGLIFRNTWASYTHVFAPALPVWARNFSRLADKVHAGQC